MNGNIRMSSGLTEMRVRRLDDAPGPRWARVVLDDATDPATSMTIAPPRRAARESMLRGERPNDGDADLDWLEAQQHQIRGIGYENYLAQQIHD